MKRFSPLRPIRGMETQTTVPEPPSALSRSLSVVAARERGVGPEQLPLIGTDPDIFEVVLPRARRGPAAVRRPPGRRPRAGRRPDRGDLSRRDRLGPSLPAAARHAEGVALGIARDLVANDRRRRGRERAGEERLRGSALLDEEDAARMDARIDAAAQSRRLYAAMDRLPEAERAVLELVALDELSVAEAAAAVGVRPVTARVRLHRARRKLRAELEAAANQPNPKRRRTDREPEAETRSHDFEQRLLARLKAVVAERGAAAAAARPRRRRPPRPPGAGAARAWRSAPASPSPRSRSR